MAVTSANQTKIKLRGVESVYALPYNYWTRLGYWLEREISMLFLLAEGSRHYPGTPCVGRATGISIPLLRNFSVNRGRVRDVSYGR